MSCLVFKVPISNIDMYFNSFFRHLMLNVDLVCSTESFRSANVVLTFRNLTFLSLNFNQTIELKEKIERTTRGQRMIKTVTDNLKKLKTLYLFYCPTDRLIIHSKSIERLHIYKSEFAGIKVIVLQIYLQTSWVYGLIYFI